ncbi:MAG: methyltransferase [Candidatus Hadarchaeum sp.]|nr:methyltransferase [Candidatus Hadarchaeum sp.]
MKLGVIPENPIERLLLAIKLVPTPIFDTQVAFMLARTIMAGTKLGIFETLAPGPLTAAEIATQCKTDARATIKLINALVGAGYLRIKRERYSLAPVARKWLLKDSPQSIYDKMMFHFTEWQWIENYEEYVRTGKPLSIHDMLSDEAWGVYQRGMRAVVGFQTREVVWRTPVPKNARAMLDVGGSHGYFSVAFCRRYPALRAVVLDLPQAIKHAASILAKEDMGDRVVHRVGNSLTEDLGTEAWDLILISQFAHHFDEATNRDLVRRAARALRPGGILAILDVLRPTAGKDPALALLADLYLANTSQSGSRSCEEMADWQRAAGLVPRKPVRFRSLPGFGQQAAMKPTR